MASVRVAFFVVVVLALKSKVVAENVSELLGKRRTVYEQDLSFGLS